MIKFAKKNNSGDTTASSFSNNESKSLKSYTFQYEDGELDLYTDEVDLLNSSRLRKKIGSIVNDFISNFQDQQKLQSNTFSHTLKKIHGQLSQKIDGLITHPLLQTTESYSQRKELLIEKITTNPGNAADVLMYIQKRIIELNAHMSSFEILHLGENLYIDKQPHNIRRLILSIWHGFEIFIKKKIRYKFLFEDGIADQNKCNLDYKTFSAALFNLLDNASKYAMPESEVVFNYVVNGGNYVLSIEMYSLEILPKEIDQLCELGFRGVACKKIDGTGVGLYIAKRAFDLNNLRFEIISDCNKKKSLQNVDYFQNTFQISGVCS